MLIYPEDYVVRTSDVMRLATAAAEAVMVDPPATSEDAHESIRLLAKQLNAKPLKMCRWALGNEMLWRVVVMALDAGDPHLVQRVRAGKVTRVPMSSELRAVAKGLGWHMKPPVVTREETVQVAKWIMEASGEPDRVPTYKHAHGVIRLMSDALNKRPESLVAWALDWPDGLKVLVMTHRNLLRRWEEDPGSAPATW